MKTARISRYNFLKIFQFLRKSLETSGRKKTKTNINNLKSSYKENNCKMKNINSPLVSSDFERKQEIVSRDSSTKQKTFIVAGELSGDKLGAWYIKKFCDSKNVHAVGGTFLENAGAQIYERLEKLNIVGIIEIIKHIPFVLSFIKKLSNHIIENNFQHVVLVDFPGFNLRLAKTLKQKNPNIHITYLSPPQLWVWGAWRVKKLKKHCDKIIVLYPFEVDWYKKRGVNVEWHGYPFYKKLEPYFNVARKNDHIALMPGSRKNEIQTLLPTFAHAIKLFVKKYPETKIVVPIAETVSEKEVRDILSPSTNVEFVHKKDDVYKKISECCLALTKPGTITLELALLGIPSVVAFKTSWLNYWIGRPLVKIEYMALPNLLMNEEVFKEYIQTPYSAEIIANELCTQYQNYLEENDAHLEMQEKLHKLREMLK
jgi:lipid-A-disaccharide synthase